MFRRPSSGKLPRHWNTATSFACVELAACGSAATAMRSGRSAAEKMTLGLLTGPCCTWQLAAPRTGRRAAASRSRSPASDTTRPFTVPPPVNVANVMGGGGSGESDVVPGATRPMEAGVGGGQTGRCQAMRGNASADVRSLAVASVELTIPTSACRDVAVARPDQCRVPDLGPLSVWVPSVGGHTGRTTWLMELLGRGPLVRAEVMHPIAITDPTRAALFASHGPNSNRKLSCTKIRHPMGGSAQTAMSGGVRVKTSACAVT